MPFRAPYGFTKLEILLRYLVEGRGKAGRARTDTNITQNILVGDLSSKWTAQPER